MANIRVKDLDAKASFASDDEILMDSPSGTGTMLRDAFIAAVASQIVGAPSTYKIATLDGADKLTSSQDPSQSVSYLGGHDMVANSPALADGSGTAGDTYYVTNPGTRNYGSGNITAQEGDALVYSGSVWQLVEGIANILDGISTASTARTTLEVNSIDEDAQANALKTTAPALCFDGSSSVVTVADDDKFSFTDGTDDLPFSISAWINMTDATAFVIASKHVSAREWVFRTDGSDKLLLNVSDTTNTPERLADSALTGYEGSWIHVCATYSGAGPNSANGFPAAADGVTLYVNGSVVASTAANSVSYTGMSNGADPVHIGRQTSTYAEGSIRGVKIFNRELTATEVAELARGNDLGFSDEWGDQTTNLVVDGDMEDSGTADWTANAVTLSKPTVDPQQAVRNIKAILNGGVTGYFETAATTVQANKRYRAKFYYRTGGTSPTAYSFRVNGGSWQVVSTLSDQASWTYHEVEFVVNSDTTGDIAFHINSGTDASTFIEVDNFEVVPIGTLADFRAEDYNESASKLLDRSSNNFVGVGTSVTLTGNQRHISADTIDLKNLPTSSAGLSAGEVWSNSGVLTVV